MRSRDIERQREERQRNKNGGRERAERKGREKG